MFFLYSILLAVGCTLTLSPIVYRTLERAVKIKVAAVMAIVLVSILMHGLTVTPVMRSLDRHHGRDPDAEDEAGTAEPQKEKAAPPG